MEKNFGIEKSQFEKTFPRSYTYNDILLVPQFSDIQTRNNCIVESLFSKNIPLKVPLVSSPMDTVTEAKMAIGMARQGGIGVLHRFCSIEEQVEMLKKVKRAENFIIEEPYIIDHNESIEKVLEIKRDLGITSFLVTSLSKERKKSFYMDLEEQKQTPYYDIHKVAFAKRKISSKENFKLEGIITSRDLKAYKGSDQQVKDLMTKREQLQVYTKPNELNMNELDKVYLYDQLVQNRLEKIPIVDDKNNIIGLVTEQDLFREKMNKLSNRNKLGQLYTAAAIGSRGEYLTRADALVQNGCDALVVDVANGHNQMTIQRVAELKEYFSGQNVDIVAGNVCTGEGSRKLVEAGADSIRVGIGNGSICITRIVSGSGVPQLTALMSIYQAHQKEGYDIPIISDGGNKNSGNMCKALALGADCLMMGRLVSGTDESPGKPFLKDGRYMKIHRGMAGYGANLSKAQRMGKKNPDSIGFTPEGVEGYINYSGSLKSVLMRFVMGIKSGMSYVGARSIKELRQKAKFTLISANSGMLSQVHGIKKY